MACGAPVIASDIPALREAGGDAALYYGAPDDAAALGALLERVRTGALPLDDWRRRAVAHAAGYTWDAARAAVWDAVAASAT
jgi:glycosyltransferase involved in cell wall biosynthesis